MTDTSASPGRVTAIYDAIDAFQRQHQTAGGLQHAQIRALLAEHLDQALPQASAPQPPAGRAALRDRIAEVLWPLTDWDGDQLNAEAAADAVLAVLPPPVDRGAVLAATLREVLATFSPMKDTHDGPVAYYDGSADIDPEQYDRWRAVLDGEPRRLANEAQPAETDEQRADREETERDHARGDHTHCGITCETEMPTEHLRNFVIAKGYPGTKGALAELERRAAAGARQDGAQP